MNEAEKSLKRAKVFAVLSVLCFFLLFVVYTFGPYIENSFYDDEGADYHELNALSTVFSAAQTYVTDLYKQNDGEIVRDVTCDDLVAAGLLTQNPEDRWGRITICVCEDRPAVKDVSTAKYTYPMEYGYEAGETKHEQ